MNSAGNEEEGATKQARKGRIVGDGVEWKEEARAKEWVLAKSGKRSGEKAVARKGECAGDRGQRNKERTLAEKKTK